MLSRVAERVYWAARYLERVESTARLVSIYDKLLFDLPRNVQLSWYNLIAINDLEADFAERYSVRDERNVVKFLLGDTSNPSSIVSSLRGIRENVRTTRDVVLEETWELTNELSLYVNENLQQGINRSQRHEFLENIIKGCQQILGLLYGSMPHDAAWDFLRLGRNLERSDMTSRILDAGVSAILEMKEDDNAVNSRQIIWGNVLRSVNGAQSYRRTVRSSVKGEEVVRYLLENKAFPRSVAHCLDAMIDSAARLPHSKPVLTILKETRKSIFSEVNYQVLDERLRDYLNNLQLVHGKIHCCVGETWFPVV
ncbi:MAG: alpha-E domain-containing protein [Pseudomonadales bacterium]|nr:alpha-E domain-containing protein [Pseudomonadales bacterium]